MKKTLAALAGALVAQPVLAAGPQGFAAAPQAQGPIALNMYCLFWS